MAEDLRKLSYTTQEVQDILDAVGGKYEKPSSGIPSSDIATGVIPDVSGFISASASPNEVKHIWSGTQAQYDALTPREDTLYFIKSEL